MFEKLSIFSSSSEFPSLAILKVYPKNNMKKNDNIEASNVLIFQSDKSKIKTDATNIKYGISFFIVDFGKVIGAINAVIHKINNIFDILLHNIFDTAKSVFPVNHEIRLMTNSGALDPNATIVNQITSDDIQNLVAIELAPSTNTSDHFINKTNQITKNI